MEVEPSASFWGWDLRQRLSLAMMPGCCAEVLRVTYRRSKKTCKAASFKLYMPVAKESSEHSSWGSAQSSKAELIASRASACTNDLDDRILC